MQEELDKRLCRRDMIIYGAILLGSVIWFCLTLAKTTKDVKRVKSWVETPCLIKDRYITMNMAEAPFTTYFWVISYAYEYDGRQYTSSRYSIIEENKVLGDGWKLSAMADAQRAGRRVEKPYPVGEKSVCFVNSESPSESGLVREVRNKAIVGRLLLPGVVIATFLTLLLYTLWRYWYWFRWCNGSGL